MTDRWAWLHDAVPPPGGRDERTTARALAGLACAIAARQRVALPELRLLSAWGDPRPVRVPDGVVADAWLLGEALEVLVSDDDRRRRGVHHTPAPVARAVARLALLRAGPGATPICDPAVGGGAFLLAAAELLCAGGVAPARAVHAVAGIDVDPLAVAVTEAALCLWSGGHLGAGLVVGDALCVGEEAWGAPAVVVGNPPFLGQLRTATARTPGRAVLRPEAAAVAGPYTDTAALFAALAVGAVVPGGHVALLLPRSFLVARDAGRARRATLASADLDHVWLPEGRIFGAAVDVCVPVWRRHPAATSAGVATPVSPVAPPSRASTVEDDRGRRPGSEGVAPPARDLRPAEPGRSLRRQEPGAVVTRSAGMPPAPAAPCRPPSSGSHSWSHLLAGSGGEPAVPSLVGMRSGGALGDRCTATAGFRDQFYGLIPFVFDDADGGYDDVDHAPLVTSGLIDHACSRWGAHATRYAGRRWEAPRVDVAAVQASGGALARWVTGKRVRKVLVAAQTRTIEAVADVAGTWLPSTPVATLVPEPGFHWHVLAVLLSPVATAWALLHHRGTGLSGGALRLPPAALRALPTPVGGPSWDLAAGAVEAASRTTAAAPRRALLTSAAALMCDAYRVDAGPATAWWASRLPVS